MSDQGIPGAATTLLAADLRRRPISLRVLRERTLAGAAFTFALISILTTFGIVFVLLEGSLAFFRQVSLIEYLTGTRWTPLFASQSFGVLPIVNASVLIALIAMLVAIPLGLGSAIYLAEFAPRRARAILKPMLEILAGIPTVVYGYFALLFITPILRTLIPGTEVFNALSAGIAMGIMITPMVASLSEDAISAVPSSLREAAAGLGATDMERVIGITVPAALSGIVASFILATSRAIGETTIVAIAAGNHPALHFNPLAGMQTMTAYIVQVALGDTPRGTLEYSTVFAVGATLFVITLTMNIVSRMIVRRYREVYQ